MRRTILSALLTVLVTSAATAQSAGPDSAADPHRWLEDLNGERVMAWVRTENARTSNILENDPRFAGIRAQALSMAQAQDRLPDVTFIGGALYNFWQDSTHVRGIWRKTSLTSYRSASPTWVTVLDLDELARKDNANWVWQGAICSEPTEDRCLVSLSDGGEDAVTLREFDVVARRFVANGFSLPKGKQGVAWMGRDTLLVAREWTPGEMTTSGYAYVVKRLVRGQALASAVEIYRGKPSDMMVQPFTVTDASGHSLTVIARRPSFFEAEHHVLGPNGLAKLNMPMKSNVLGMLDNQVLVKLADVWMTGAATIASGAVASFDATAALRTPGALAPVAVFEPSARESVQGVDVSQARVLVSITRNVTGQVLAFTHEKSGAWTPVTLKLPANVSTQVLSADRRSNRAFVSVTGYLTPSSIWLADAGTAAVSQLKTLAPRFDASRMVVEQFEVASSDGVKVPYFVVRPKGMTLDGNSPTIIYAYGGFEISLTPQYNANMGKLWVERGGVYVVANIRGGGEFGPAWHDAGLKTKRQIIYDDFAAVARDLIARRITSPKKLGIQGGSNGGLLMGVQMTQHPELFSAVDIQVPLLDMLRYEYIQAGASWVGEYGSVTVPAERAFLASISPLHNLRSNVSYPTPLIWTTTKDDRVGPQHARKFAAQMSALGLPYLFYEVTEGGHGAGANIEQRVQTTALEFTYFMRQLMGPVAITP